MDRRKKLRGVTGVTGLPISSVSPARVQSISSQSITSVTEPADRPLAGQEADDEEAIMALILSGAI